MPETVDTLILRFRDLVTSEGRTIVEHYDICKEGSVWWGWWKKAGEKVPLDVFQALAKQASKGGLTLFLVDSGRLQLYQVKCTEIYWDLTGDKKISPDAKITPAYYNTLEYYAWFRFSEMNIIPIKEEELHEFTYHQVDSFFEDNKSRYTMFYNKVVFSIEELKQQERTIWFVRKRQGNDPFHFVSLLDAKRLRPNDFPDDFIRSNSKNILWVSDLHYTDTGNHEFPHTADGGVDRTLGVALNEAFITHKVKDIGGLIVSGDITWKATKDEFDFAKPFFRWTTNVGIRENYQIALCPGNHDIAFSRVNLKERCEVRAALPEDRKQFEDFYQDLFYILPNAFLCSGRRFLINGIIPVEIVCLNTSHLQQGPVEAESADASPDVNYFKGQGFVGADQLTHVENEMRWMDESEPDKPRAFRILVMHHHLVPITYRTKPMPGQLQSVVLDAEAIMRWISKHRINLVLHGHMHQPYCVKLTRPKVDKWGEPDHEFHIIALGSTGVSKSHLGETPHNTFGILKFGVKAVTVNVYSVHKANESLPINSIEIPYGET